MDIEASIISIFVCLVLEKGEDGKALCLNVNEYFREQARPRRHRDKFLKADIFFDASFFFSFDSLIPISLSISADK